MERLDHETLHRFTTAVLERTGASPETAATVADSLVAAEIRGHPSHGLQLLPAYVGWAGGPLDPIADAEVVERRPGAALVDGNHGFGHPVGREATRLAMEMVASQAIAVVGIRRATHLGRIGWFAEQAAAEGLGFVAFTNMTSGDPVAPAGSAQRRFGTNPVTFSLPSFDAVDHPVLLDIATSQVAYGKLNVRQMAGESIHPSWTVDEDGDPVLDPDTFNEEEVGALAPLGGQDAGYKGTGLMLMAELFAATVSDSPVTPQPDALYENAAFFAVFDPIVFTTREAHEARIEALEIYLDETEYSAAIDAGTGTDADRALLPGRREHEIRLKYEREGVPVPDPIRERLAALGREQGLDEEVVRPVARE